MLTEVETESKPTWDFVVWHARGCAKSLEKDIEEGNVFHAKNALKILVDFLLMHRSIDARRLSGLRAELVSAAAEHEAHFERFKADYYAERDYERAEQLAAARGEIAEAAPRASELEATEPPAA